MSQVFLGDKGRRIFKRMSQRNPHIVDKNKAKQELDRMKESQKIMVQKALNKHI